MSKKILKGALAIGLAIGAVVLAPVAGAALAFAVAGFEATAALVTVGTIVAGVGLSLGGAMIGKALGLNKPGKLNAASLDRLNASLNPQAARKIVFGRTAMASDVSFAR